ncbi:MAG: DUF423 domain-containing protein [Bdellovibrionota bacterium]|nr:MAG: DUF423 domain-containing protein [Bdellovibrionota bacterium]
MVSFSAYRCAGIAALLMGVGIAAGAFGAHALKTRLDPYLLGVYEKAVLYQLINSLGLIGVAIAATTFKDDSLLRPALLIVLGVIIFSGTLYGLSLFGQRWLGAITPLGGSALIIGWLWLAWILLRK